MLDMMFLPWSTAMDGLRETIVSAKFRTIRHWGPIPMCFDLIGVLAWHEEMLRGWAVKV